MTTLPQTWDDIRDRFMNLESDEPWAAAILAIVARIETSPLAEGLYPWTAMFDLLISQTQAPPEDGGYPVPHLRISPKPEQKIEFRYVDTWDSSRQWVREVDASYAVERFDKFIEQLGWLQQS